MSGHGLQDRLGRPRLTDQNELYSLILETTRKTFPSLTTVIPLPFLITDKQSAGLMTGTKPKNCKNIWEARRLASSSLSSGGNSAQGTNVRLNVFKLT